MQHQAFAGSLDDYAAVSEASMKKMGWTTTSSRADGDAYFAEATGTMRGPKGNVELHFYFKAIRSGGNVILATATTPEARWQTEKEVLKPVVDSLKPLKK
ncbi:MAG TPA: hypothetical protein VHV77_02900 [Pirellulales bacterium]|nr:hypothetical protein [Pirellulales bacterium]